MWNYGKQARYERRTGLKTENEISQGTVNHPNECDQIIGFTHPRTRWTAVYSQGVDFHTGNGAKCCWLQDNCKGQPTHQHLEVMRRS